MIKLYYNYRGSTFRNLVQWFNDHQIEHETIKINRDNLSYQQFLQILELNEGDLRRILSKHYTQSIINSENVSLRDLYDLIVENPLLVSNLISVDLDKCKLCVGFNKERIRMFIPHEERMQFMQEVLNAGQGVTR